MFGIIGAMAEFERSLIQQRVKAGIENARAKGKRIGRKPTPWICHVSGRCDQKGTIRRIASLLGCSRSLVHKALSAYVSWH
jgi:DNA invertase Pin-like site-specific DNA recombinase